MEGCRNKELERLLKGFKGQPVEILTDDGVRYCGIELDANDESTEIVDKCGRVIFITFDHITAIVEPKMKLDRFCGDNDCDCHKKHDDDCEG